MLQGLMYPQIVRVIVVNEDTEEGLCIPFYLSTMHISPVIYFFIHHGYFQNKT